MKVHEHVTTNTDTNTQDIVVIAGPSSSRYEEPVCLGTRKRELCLSNDGAMDDVSDENYSLPDYECDSQDMSIKDIFPTY